MMRIRPILIAAVATALGFALLDVVIRNRQSGADSRSVGYEVAVPAETAPPAEQKPLDLHSPPTPQAVKVAMPKGLPVDGSKPLLGLDSESLRNGAVPDFNKLPPRPLEEFLNPRLEN